MLSDSNAAYLLDALCIEHGFCLAPSGRAAILSHPPATATDFALTVFRMERLDPTLHNALYSRVLAVVEQAFENAAPPPLSRLRARLGKELALIDDVALREALQAILIEPRRELRHWDYGVAGERYPCWVVAQDRELILVYCEQGFGPDSPWGFIDAAPDASLGMDSQWCWYLEEAFVRSGLWSGAVNPGYE